MKLFVTLLCISPETMISATELRNGNIISLYGTPKEALSFYKTQIVYKHLCLEPSEYINTPKILYIKEFDGIKISEDWLLRFGFEKKEKYGWFGNGSDHQSEASGTNYQDYVLPKLIYRESEWFYTEKDGTRHIERSAHVLHTENWYQKTEINPIYCPLDFIHQLQNLYFALT